MTLLQYTSLWMRLNNHLVRVSKPFSDISEVFTSLGVSMASLLFKFRSIPGVMEATATVALILCCLSHCNDCVLHRVESG